MIPQFEDHALHFEMSRVCAEVVLAGLSDGCRRAGRAGFAADDGEDQVDCHQPAACELHNGLMLKEYPLMESTYILPGSWTIETKQ